MLQYFAVSYFVTSFTVLLLMPLTQESLSTYVAGKSVEPVHPQTSPDDMQEEVEESGTEKIDSLASATNASRASGSRCQGLPGSSATSHILVNCREKFVKIITLDERSLSVFWAYRHEWVVQAILLSIYFILCVAAAAPGCPVGYNGPGGLSDYKSNKKCTGGIHRFLDIMLFTNKHIYQKPTCMEIYDCKSHDPEGALGSLSACTLTYLGLMSGRVLVHFKSHGDRVRIWLGMAMICLFVGGVLCGFSKNEGFIPINKNLWSVSFCTVSAGSGLLLLAFTYIIVDVYKYCSGAPFNWLGMNSILIYCSHGILHRYFPFSYATDSTSHARLLERDVIGASMWLFVAYFFYSVKFFVSV